MIFNKKLPVKKLIAIYTLTLSAAAFGQNPSEDGAESSRDDMHLDSNLLENPRKPSVVIANDLSVCISKIKYFGSVKLSKSNEAELSKNWCNIAIGNQELLDAIEIDDEFNVGVVKKGKEPSFLRVGKPFLESILKPQYKGALQFTLAHELGHYIKEDNNIRKDKSLKAYAAALVTLAVGTTLLKKGALGKKTIALGAMGIATYKLYCHAFSKYKNNEIEADKFAINHLKSIGYDPTVPAMNMLAFGNDLKMDAIPQECLSLEQILEKRSIHVASRNPHPTIMERQEVIKTLLRE